MDMTTFVVTWIKMGLLGWALYFVYAIIYVLCHVARVYNRCGEPYDNKWLEDIELAAGRVQQPKWFVLAKFVCWPMGVIHSIGIIDEAVQYADEKAKSYPEKEAPA